MMPEEVALIQKAYIVQGDLFQDMICCGNGFERTQSLPNNLECFALESYHFSIADDEETVGRFDEETKTLSIGKEYTEDERVWLHELIHLYEHNLESVPGGMVFRDAVIWHLYCKLRDSISDLDKIISMYMQMDYISHIYHLGWTHDLLFFIKSLDIDLAKGWARYTTFGYDVEEFIRNNMEAATAEGAP